jgi:hypothetical protein
MSKKILTAVNRIRFLPEILAIAAAMSYLIQAIVYSQIQLPNLDEGAYLFKGYQFAIGNFQPFQAYGFWTNKMYLSFFVWGWIQKLFSPGLLAPRLFAILFSFLTLVGTWIITRRLGNRWIAAFSVLVFALNPTFISIYSLANSQVLVACILTWALVLTLGNGRPNWQIFTGTFLSALMVFFRENMIIVVPLLIGYFFWQHGKKIGFYSLGITILVLVIGHLIYWPEITYIWTRWIPNILNSTGISLTTNLDMNQTSIISRIHSLTVAFRIYFVPFLCCFMTLLLWRRKNEWQSADHYRVGVFLLVTFLILLVSHAWASVGNDYCVYCSTTYFAFFINLGLFLFAASYTSLTHSPNIINKFVLLVSTPILISAIYFSLYEKIGFSMIKKVLPSSDNGKILPGTITIWETLHDRFNMPIETSRLLVPTIFGLFIGILILFLSYLLFNILLKSKIKNIIFSYVIFFIFLGVLATPLLGLPVQESFCNTNVPSMYKNVSQQVKNEIPNGSTIYIDGRLSAIPFLYLDNVKFYPPQINGRYSFKSDKNSDELLRKGLWNEELANTWRNETNYFIIGADTIQSWKDYFTEHGATDIFVKLNNSVCPASSELFLYKNK